MTPREPVEDATYVPVSDLIATHTAVMLIVDPAADAIVDANLAAERFYGCARDTLRSTPLSQVAAGPDQHHVRGTLCPVWVQRGPVPQAGGQELWVVVDLTERRAAEERARDAVERLEFAERLANLGTWEVDVSRGKVTLSPGMYEIYGRSPSESEGRAEWFFEIMHPEDREAMIAWQVAFDAGRAHGAHEFRVVRPDGTVRHVRGEGALRVAESGRPVRTLSVVRDVTTEVEALHALRDREQRLELAVSASHLGLFDLDLTTGATVVNAEYARMLGYPPETFVESNEAWLGRVHPDQTEQVTSAFLDYLQGRSTSMRLEYQQRTADGRWCWLLCTAKIVARSAEGLPLRMLGTHTDITPFKETEARLLRYSERARALLEIPAASAGLDETQFLTLGLRAALRLTASAIGFVHLVDEDQRTLELAAWIDPDRPAPEHIVRRRFGLDAVGLWAKTVRDHEPAILNQLPEDGVGTSLPHGHTPLSRLLVVPIVHDNRVWMVIGVGNGHRDYDSFDVDTLRLVGEQLWQISHQRRSTAALAASGQFSALLLENLAEGVVACDAHGRLSVFNRTAREWHGAPPNPLLSPEEWAASYDLYAEDGTTPLTPETIPLARAFQGEEIRNEVMCIAARGQPLRTVLASGGPVLDSTGTKVGALMVLHDITELAASRSRQSLQSAALDAAANAIVITDRNGHVEWANPAFTELTGFGVDEALGRNPRELLRSGTHTTSFYADMWSTILDGRVWSGELTNRRKDGTLYPEAMTITPVPDANGEIKHFIAIKRALTAERALQTQLMQAQKMESVGRLAGGIAHDFNNLLTVINGTVELALSQMQPQDPLTEDLEEVRAAATRAAALTRQLLAFSRQQILKREVIELDLVVRDLSKMLRRLIGEDIELVTQLDPCGHVLADAGQIEQVIVNLVVNARDAMPSGGRLELSTRLVELGPDARDRDALITPGHYAEVCVCDTGVGMDADTQARLFEPFFTTKEVGKGTGLGLATVYGIIKQTGGHIHITSTVGVGSQFVILLPVTERAQPLASPRMDAAKTRGRAHVVMVVDDDAAVRGLTERMLSRAGYTVLSASGPREALHRLSSADAPAVDLLLTDLVMPEMSGAELAVALHQTKPGLRVLFMSGYTDDRVLQHAQHVDVHSLLHKPFTVAELTTRVRQALERG